MDLHYWVNQALAGIESWEQKFGPYEPHPALRINDREFGAAFRGFMARIADNHPFFHPRYAGPMIKPPHPAAVVGYLAAMLINPNNHAREAGPATADMEREVIERLAAMFGLPVPFGHLTSGGTIANLEALYVARESHPGKGVAYSADSHYTQARMCHVLGIEGHRVPADGRGRIDLDALEDVLRTGRVGTVVLTMGTTGLGAVDPVHEALALKERYGVRLHVDAAYGGSSRCWPGRARPSRCRARPGRPSPAATRSSSTRTSTVSSRTAAARCCSPTRRWAGSTPTTRPTPTSPPRAEPGHRTWARSAWSAPATGRRRGAVADLPGAAPTAAGLGEVLAAGRRAARRLAGAVTGSPYLALYQEPELDIVGCYPLYLGTLRAEAADFARRGAEVVADAGSARILRSVLMKPEAETHHERVFGRLEELAADALADPPRGAPDPA